jgi:hypothetical protein
VVTLHSERIGNTFAPKVWGILWPAETAAASRQIPPRTVFQSVNGAGRVSRRLRVRRHPSVLIRSIEQRHRLPLWDRFCSQP